MLFFTSVMTLLMWLDQDLLEQKWESGTKEYRSSQTNGHVYFYRLKELNIITWNLLTSNFTCVQKQTRHKLFKFTYPRLLTIHIPHDPAIPKFVHKKDFFQISKFLTLLYGTS